MIHIATVHYQTDKWIDIQLRYIKKYILKDYRVYAFLDGEAAKHKDKFYYACLESIQDQGHAKKLNILADIISFVAADDDILIFLDGDAFPIGNIMELINEKISLHKLLAIQRLENMGDIQPHPSFCATTVGFWNELNGDWKKGYYWENKIGKATDVGGNLLKIFIEKQIHWYPIHRTSQLGLHPLWFSIYAKVIYHNGAGFRKYGIDRITAYYKGFKQKRENIFSRILDKIPDDLIIKIKWKVHPVKRMRKRVYQELEDERKHIYIRLKSDDELLFKDQD